MRFPFNLVVSLLLLSPNLVAESFPMPGPEDSLIGEVSRIAAAYEDTFPRLARTYNFGYLEMRLANPDVDPWLPGTGTPVKLPSLYVLPDTPREGIVINLAEMRLYYYLPVDGDEQVRVHTYPIGIGREAFPTPELSTRVRARIPNPAWYPPESIIAEYAERGVTLPRTVPPGPDNPMGDHAIQLDAPGYFIHGTNKTAGIGLRVSHGCIRMYPEDIEELFNQISIGTPVRVIHQPVKVGIRDSVVYVEVHPSTRDNAESIAWQVTSQLGNLLPGDRQVVMDWRAIDRIAAKPSGIPVAVARLSTGEAATAAR